MILTKNDQINVRLFREMRVSSADGSVRSDNILFLPLFIYLFVSFFFFPTKYFFDFLFDEPFSYFIINFFHSNILEILKSHPQKNN